ncbi:hypothetical protein AB0758_47275 [Tolypothrix bouteillei VB521301_2]|uniref:YrrC family ATP-dependent DNA helicase n=1 Tax=Tolypothrix bouteillei TaxID=1246981 RepID=UPI0038B4BC70
MSTAPNSQPQTNATPRYETIAGVVERLTYYSQESGYTVARMKCSGMPELTTITGNFADIQPGQTLQLTGFWREHPQYGAQFQVTQYKETKLPATPYRNGKVLGQWSHQRCWSGDCQRIVTHFGLETLDIIEHQIHRLVEVKGIAKKRITMIQRAWEAQKAIKEVMVFLQGHGVSTTYAVKFSSSMGMEL